MRCSYSTGVDELHCAELEAYTATLLDGLTEKERSAIERHLLDGMSLREIAKSEGLTPTGISARISKGIQKLRNKVLSKSEMFEELMPDMHWHVVLWRKTLKEKQEIRRFVPEPRLPVSVKRIPEIEFTPSWQYPPITPCNRVSISAMVHIQKSNDPNDAWDNVVIEPL